MSEVVDNAGGQRYELAVDGATAIAAYFRDGDIVTFTHTEVPSALEGEGVGGRLVAGALADIRCRALKIVPACSFVRHYIDTHPDTQDLVAR